VPPRDPLKGRELVLGVTGSIAAYKAADLVSALVKRGLGVTVVLTEGAAAFIGPLTLATLSRRPVVTSLFDPAGAGIEHVDISERSDVMLVAPATANVLAKLALGIADDALTTTALALKRRTPLLVAPAMNTRMWEHPATGENLERLAARGVVVIPPAEGILACGTTGWGKLAAVETLVAALEEALNKA
jgi:phosphopantothenoylcysteine synthetase/decarboxylase